MEVVQRENNSNGCWGDEQAVGYLRKDSSYQEGCVGQEKRFLNINDGSFCEWP
jgi:hypothetical protein